MSFSNGESRSPEFGPVTEDSKLKRQPRCLGDATGASGEYGINQVAISGDDSYRGDTVTSKEWGSHQVEGKVIDQLAGEVEKEISYHKSQVHDREKEISYHKSQVHDLESRLNKLRQLSGELKKTSSSD